LGKRGCKKIFKNTEEMKSYFADTNFYLRFILKDNQNQAEESKKFLTRAKNGEIKIIFLPEVIFEMEFVLRSVYSLSKKEVVKYLLPLIKTDYLEIQDREIWLVAFKIFQEKSFPLFDIFLFLKAKRKEGEVLSFDKDFKKLKKFFNEKNYHSY